MKKILLILISFMLSSACTQSVALLGPAITVGKTGNIMQAGFSYGGNLAIKQATGKTAIEHVYSYVEENKTSDLVIKQSTSKPPIEHVYSYVVEKKTTSNKENRAEKKINNQMISFLKSHIEITRLKLLPKNKL